MIKRMICLILLFCVAATLPACVQNQDKIQVPVNFYYLRQETTYGSADSLIAPITAEGADYSNDPAGLLSQYLKGPGQNGWVSPFPRGTQLLSMELVNGFLRLTLSENFASLTGMDLTIACACLTLTALDLTGANSVRISVEGATLNGAEYIRMDRNCLTLLDINENDSQ